MYVAVKGGEQAIANAHRWLAAERRGDPATAGAFRRRRSRAAEVACRSGDERGLAATTAPLAALAIKQAQGDLIEAAFLLRAYRTTLPRFGYASRSTRRAMAIRRRISAMFKDLPGGQVLGPTFDYTHRLLDFGSLAEGRASSRRPKRRADAHEAMPRVLDILTTRG